MVHSGFYDVTLVDADAVGPTVPMGDLSRLRRQWPGEVVSGISRKQMELEQLRHACKKALSWCTEWLLPVLCHEHRT